MNDLLNKLISVDMWVYNGIINNIEYQFRFSESMRIEFHHIVDDEDGFGFGGYKSYSGKFTVENNNITAFFSRNLKYKHDEEYCYVDGRIKKMAIIFEINGIIENKIIVKQISGNSIFENHDLDTEFEFTSASFSPKW
jgi:hypothetical protein